MSLKLDSDYESSLKPAISETEKGPGVFMPAGFPGSSEIQVLPIPPVLSNPI